MNSTQNFMNLSLASQRIYPFDRSAKFFYDSNREFATDVKPYFIAPIFLREADQLITSVKVLCHSGMHRFRKEVTSFGASAFLARL
jgi:hypothetical protein